MLPGDLPESQKVPGYDYEAADRDSGPAVKGVSDMPVHYAADEVRREVRALTWIEITIKRRITRRISMLLFAPTLISSLGFRGLYSPRRYGQPVSSSAIRGAGKIVPDPLDGKSGCLEHGLK